MTSSNPLPYWLAALHLPGVGPVKLHRWLAYFDSIESIFQASVGAYQAAGVSEKDIHALQHPNWQAVERDLLWAEKPECHIVTFASDDYPILLRQLNDAPVVLYVRGQVKHLAKPQIAMVGTRNPTVAGRELAQQFAYHLAKEGLIVTSGLAMGVDAASHQGALGANSPTIAVTGTGLNHVYPVSHISLAEKIAAHGALVSEFPPDTLPIAYHFPRRNRIISGLSLGVLVVEAAIRSGSLITARFAAEQGREVFAIPGSIHNPLARGCHKLIQQGAKLVEKAQDILEELTVLSKVISPQLDENKAVLPAESDQKMNQVLQAVGFETTALDTIMIRSGLTVSEVSSMLLSLELRSYVKNVPGGYVRTPP